MSSCPIGRVARSISLLREILDAHASQCGDRVLAFVLHLEHHETLSLVEMWGIPVLGSEAVEMGRVKLVCESNAVLIPPVDTFEDLLDRWTHHDPPCREQP
jgi:hypothetical protein